MTTVNITNSSEVVIFGTIDAGNDGRQILLALLKQHDPRNYTLDDFTFGAPVALTGQDTVVDVIPSTTGGVSTAIVRNTRIFLMPRASVGLYGPKIMYYDRIHASDLPATTVSIGTSTTVYEILAKLNVKTGLGITEADVVDGPLPAPDVDGIVQVPLVFKPTSLIFYGTTKIQAIDYQFGGLANYVTAGTVFDTYCYGTNLMRVIADGRGGVQTVLGESNSSLCPLPTAGADGRPGMDGSSAFQIAAAAGFTGDHAAWLLSLKGDTGAKGLDGADGKSAYHAAITAGYFGTETDWLNSLKGKDGKDGINGTSGVNGTNGIDGQDGAKGDTGKDGAIGPAGDDGAQGATGKVQLPPVACSDEFTPLTVAADIVAFHWVVDQPFSSIWAGLTTPQTDGAPITIDVKVDGLSILSTPITIDNNEQTSLTAAIQPVVTTNSITTGQRVTISITQVGDGTATGLKLYWVTDENYSVNPAANELTLRANAGRTFGFEYQFNRLAGSIDLNAGFSYLEGSTIDSAGNVISIGGCNSQDPLLEGRYVASIMKTNAQGQLLWQKNYTLETGNPTYGEVVVVDSLDTIFAFVTEYPLPNAEPINKLGLIKLMPDGTILLHKTIVSGLELIAFNQARVVADGILLAYQSNGDATNLDDSMHSGQYGTLTKVDFDGDVLWSINRTGEYYPPAFDVDSAGDIIVAFGTTDALDGDTCIVEKYSTAGTLIWSKATTSSQFTIDNNIQVGKIGSVAVTSHGIFISTHEENVLIQMGLDGTFVSAKRITLPVPNVDQDLYIWGMRAASDKIYISGELSKSSFAPSGAFVACIDTATGSIIKSAALRYNLTANIANYWSNTSNGSLDVRNDVLVVTGTAESSGIVYVLDTEFTPYCGSVAAPFSIDAMPLEYGDISVNYAGSAISLVTVNASVNVTDANSSIADVTRFWQSRFFQRPFSLNVLGKVKTNQIELAGTNLGSWMKDIESKTANECLLLVLSDDNAATATLNQDVKDFTATTVLSSAHALWDESYKRVKLMKEGMYKVSLTCRVECNGTAALANHWPVGLAFNLASSISPPARVVPTAMSRSSHVRMPAPDFWDPSNFEQWTDEFLFNWDGSGGTGAASISPAMHTDCATELLAADLSVVYQMVVSVVRVGKSFPEVPLA